MRWLEGQWYRSTAWQLLLWPLSQLYSLLRFLRRLCYRAGLIPSDKLPVPVIVVGNISVGGTGKTPLVIWLARYLKAKGLRPGIVSRGYGGASRAPQPVLGISDTASAGDEPVLLARRSGCPVWVGRERSAAARLLLNDHPDCNILLCDDGLQHYRLRRDLEIVVIDGVRGLGNGFLLPAGPLREPKSRLDSVDAVVVNGSGGFARQKERGSFNMAISGETFYNLADQSLIAQASDFGTKNVRAIAGMGNPERFFALLQTLGLKFTAHRFPDHHAFSAQDLKFEGAGAIIMTEKDAVKCEKFAAPNMWFLPVEAVVDAALGELVLRRLKR